MYIKHQRMCQFCQASNRARQQVCESVVNSRNWQNRKPKFLKRQSPSHQSVVLQSRRLQVGERSVIHLENKWSAEKVTRELHAAPNYGQTFTLDGRIPSLTIKQFSTGKGDWMQKIIVLLQDVIEHRTLHHHHEKQKQGQKKTNHQRKNIGKA